ncbi:FadR/GntR family transcriptional regulator [Cohaesibacter haloalkalitolerans]|uniref:FadR/GntR family transcriptional regulator n=1 Tax=Cohaesibacter haloalkalitolerans TaxID=1162980 RepID=UPI0013C3EBBE|nr:FadR/GntR family transcriptional regulator [Cohaesibacter haloalkalitolerans]
MTKRRIAAPVRVYRQVADDLETRIDAGEFPIDCRLPNERLLATEYGVSRTCVREALLAMEISGRVSIRVGSGAFVLPPSDPIKTDARSPSEILEARLYIEPEICALAAERATPEDIEAIASSLQTMRDEHASGAEAEQGDREFHRLIAEAAGNSMLYDVLVSIWKEMEDPMWQALQRHIRSSSLRLGWIEDHDAIFAAMQAKDKRKARSSMRAHIAKVTDTLQKGKFL